MSPSSPPPILLMIRLCDRGVFETRGTGGGGGHACQLPIGAGHGSAHPGDQGGRYRDPSHRCANAAGRAWTARPGRRRGQDRAPSNSCVRSGRNQSITGPEEPLMGPENSLCAPNEYLTVAPGRDKRTTRLLMIPPDVIENAVLRKFDYIFCICV